MELRDIQEALYLMASAEHTETYKRYQVAMDHEQELIARGSPQVVIRKATADVVFWQRRLDVMESRLVAYRGVLGLAK